MEGVRRKEGGGGGGGERKHLGYGCVWHAVDPLEHLFRCSCNSVCTSFVACDAVCDGVVVCECVQPAPMLVTRPVKMVARELKAANSDCM